MTNPAALRTKKRLIFDCDGLLLDTEQIYFDIGKEISSRYGKELKWELKRSLMGLPWNEGVDLLISTLDLPITRDEYIKEADFLLVSTMSPLMIENVSKRPDPPRRRKIDQPSFFEQSCHWRCHFISEQLFQAENIGPS